MSDVPVLLGLDQSFIAITNALTFYGRAVSSGAFTKLSFSQSPDVAPDFDPNSGTRWKVSVTMRCYDKPVIDADDAKSGRFDFDPEPLYSNTWSEEGDSFFEAMERLTIKIEQDLKERHEATSMALTSLGLPDPVNVWMGEEPQFEATPEMGETRTEEESTPGS